MCFCGMVLSINPHYTYTLRSIFFTKVHLFATIVQTLYSIDFIKGIAQYLQQTSGIFSLSLMVKTSVNMGFFHSLSGI